MALEQQAQPPIQYALIDPAQRPESYKQFGELLDRSFPVPAGSHFFDDFPVWDSRYSAGAARIGAFQGTQLVGCAGVRLTQLKLSRGTTPVALIGAVATDECVRGRGVASKVVSLCVSWARERGAQTVFLWGSDHTLYERLGFKGLGEQIRLPLSELDLPPVTQSLKTGWVAALFPMLKTRSGGLVLRDSDETWIKAHKNVKWFWRGTEDNPTAYAALGRGIDLHGYVHEWGGDPISLGHLLADLRQLHGESALLSSPTLARQNGFKFESSKLEPVCLALGATLPDQNRIWLWGLDGA